jgi:cyanamide hydratase family protein with HD domain
MAISAQQFPDWKVSAETWFLTCLLHDIGTVDKYTREVLMSFEFYGAFLAMDVLQQNGSPQSQAQSVAEAIIRHQDPVEAGSITILGLLTQLATAFGKESWFIDCMLTHGILLSLPHFSMLNTNLNVCAHQIIWVITLIMFMATPSWML